MRSLISVLVLILIGSVYADDATIDSFPPALDSVAVSYIDSAMILSGTSRMDTEFEKKWASDTLFQLKIVERMLDYPLEIADTIDSWTEFCLNDRNKAISLARWMFSRIDEPLKSKEIAKFEKRIEKIARKDTTGSQLPETYANALRLILASFDVASEHREKMLAESSEKSLDSLLFLLPGFWTDGEDSFADTLQCYFLELLGHECDTSVEIHLDSLYETMYNIDLQELGLATAAVLQGVKLASEEIQTDSLLPGLREPLEIETRWGKAIIGTKNTDIFGDAAIIIDPGGDDIYMGYHASGVIGRDLFGSVIDLSGNDHYDSRGNICAAASGVFGVGVLCDYDGDDIYSASHYSLGAGMFGSGILLDYSGDDIYSGGVYTQGAGNFGIGLLVDEKGEDGYRSYAYAQAFAGPKGMGLLLDADGSDQYFSGGKYSHAPLSPFDYHSFAQGFSIGWRPDVSGGVGFLLDKSGNDTYSAGVYSQGVSYWYSFAALVDNAGNDVYTSVWYPQGSGIHLSVGALIDRAGNDIYVSPQGPGQGAAHDYSVGFFSEYRGNDIYVIDGGNGLALTNSVALFVDRNGKDTYSRRYPHTINYAGTRSARGTGNLSLFLDLAGEDLYSDDKVANNSYWFKGDVGIGMDIDGELFPDPVKELAEEIAEEEPDTDRTIEDIFNDASAWAVGSGADKAKKAFDELVDSGEVAVEYICEHQLDSKSALRIRTIKNFSEEVPELMKPCLFEALHDDNRRRKGNAIYILGEIKDTAAVDSLLPLLGEKKSRIGVISALGKIADTSAVMPIIKWRKEERQSARYIVAKALAEIGDPRAIPALLDFLGDDYLTVRVAAQFGLKDMLDDAFDTTIALIATAKPREKLQLLRVLSGMCDKMKTDEELDSDFVEMKLARARSSVLQLLDSKDSVVRGHAVRTLGAIGGDETIAELRRRYELETDPFVRSMYRQSLE